MKMKRIMLAGISALLLAGCGAAADSDSGESSAGNSEVSTAESVVASTEERSMSEEEMHDFLTGVWTNEAGDRWYVFDGKGYTPLILGAQTSWTDMEEMLGRQLPYYLSAVDEATRTFTVKAKDDAFNKEYEWTYTLSEFGDEMTEDGETYRYLGEVDQIQSIFQNR